jgi:hypothetical protein
VLLRPPRTSSSTAVAFQERRSGPAGLASTAREAKQPDAGRDLVAQIGGQRLGATRSWLELGIATRRRSVNVPYAPEIVGPVDADCREIDATITDRPFRLG